MRPRIWMGKGRRQRRIDAERRQEERELRTDAAQLAKLDRSGYAARKERARLKGRMEAHC